MRGYSSRNGVCFPNVHFSAARSMTSDSGIGIVTGRSPAINVTLTVDEFQITRTLGVTVSSSIFSSSEVSWVFGSTAISIHRNKVKCSIETARKVRDIDIKSELLTQELEDLVFALGCHHVQS